MRKKVLVRGPALTQSGYGEHTRFLLRSLRKFPERFDIYLIALGWGQTGWLSEETEERRWMDSLIMKTHQHTKSGGQFDMSIQVSIPNEWERLAPQNIGVTAGIETTKVAPAWLEKCNIMDKVITISNHAKDVLQKTTYQGINTVTNQPATLKCETPVEIVHYPVKNVEVDALPINLDYDFNYLLVSQWGPRKNLPNAVKWWIEENWDQEVGLIVKTSIKNNSIMDRVHAEKSLKDIIADALPEESKCKVYLLHGDLTEAQMQSLYVNNRIKCLINISHGEGFGLPMFDAACNAMPVIAPNWSGQCDFLHIQYPNGKSKCMFADVNYDIAPVQDFAVWDGVVQKDSMWCYAQESHYKLRLRQTRTNLSKWKKKAKTLQKWILENFESEQKHKLFADTIYKQQEYDYIFVSDMFADQFVGGAELSLQSLIDAVPDKQNANFLKINCASVTEEIVTAYKGKKWIFGNIAQLKDNIIEFVSDNVSDYYFIEYDYKYCEYRNPLLHTFLEDEECDYPSTEKAKLMTKFVNCSSKTFFMSEKQLNTHKSHLPDLDHSKTVVLSSTFNNKFFENIDKYSSNTKNDKWLVLGSRSWVKGSQQSENWCRENNLEYEVVSGLSHEQFLEKMSTSKGVCFLPTGLDTCPRFIIEAKLLGCELQINENVQHCDEEWFATDDLDSIKDYLKSRIEFFWSQVA